MTEGLAVLSEVFQGAVHKAADLFLQLFRCPPLLWQAHPAKLDRLADRLIDLGWTKEVGHSVRRVPTLTRIEECHD